MSGSRGPVLIVDDDDNYAVALQRLVRRSFDATIAIGPGEALRHMGERPFPVLVTDYQMPDLFGDRLLAKVAESWPATVGILLTGHADTDELSRGSGVFRVLGKPCEREELISTLQAAIAEHDRRVAPNGRTPVG